MLLEQREQMGVIKLRVASSHLSSTSSPFGMLLVVISGVQELPDGDLWAWCEGHCLPLHGTPEGVAEDIYILGDSPRKQSCSACGMRACMYRTCERHEERRGGEEGEIRRGRGGGGGGT